MFVFSKKMKTLICRIQNDTGEKRQALYEGIAKYLTIKRRYDNNEILRQRGVGKPEFQTAFNALYSLQGQVNRQNLWKLIAKRVVREPLEQAFYDAVISISINKQQRNGRSSPTVQLSFATKAFHTVRNELPIYDDIVGEQFFGLAVKGTSYEERLASAVDCYMTLCGYYEERYKNGLQKLVAVYDKLVKQSDVIQYEDHVFSQSEALTLVSDVKKIDFVIWSFWV